MFKFFDLNVDFAEISNIYHRCGKAYKEFFEEVDNIEKTNKNKPKMSAKEYEEALIEIKDNSETVIVATIPDKKDNDYYVTGIKYDSLNRPLYKCRYKCPDCKTERNFYMKLGTKNVRCYGCQRMLKVSPATAFGEPEKGKDPNLYRDSNGNFYMAGSFEADVKTFADHESWIIKGDA